MAAWIPNSTTPLTKFQSGGYIPGGSVNVQVDTSATPASPIGGTNASAAIRAVTALNVFAKAVGQTAALDPSQDPVLAPYTSYSLA
jgi:hypothetical protein